MDEEKKRAARRGVNDELMERLIGEFTIVTFALDPAARARELILLDSDPSFWTGEEGNVL